MIRARIAAVALAVAGITATTLPAAEAATVGYRQPTVHGRVLLAIEGPADLYGMRTFARDADRRLPEFHIFTGRRACHWHPRANCVHVSKGYWRTSWAGRWETPNGHQQYIRLNLRFLRYYPRRAKRAVAAHEFGHALGLAHTRRGLMEPTPLTHSRLTWPDIRALRRAY